MILLPVGKSPSKRIAFFEEDLSWFFWIWSRVRRTSWGYVATDAIIFDTEEQKRIVEDGISEPSSGPVKSGKPFHQFFVFFKIRR